MAGSSSSSSAPAPARTTSLFEWLDSSFIRTFLCGNSFTGSDEGMKLATWTAIACEDDDEKLAMKAMYQDIHHNGGRGVPKGSLVDVDIGGEDAHFVDDLNGFVGVADGVGDKRLNGESGIYSRYLMHNAKKLASSRGREEVNDPLRLVMAARDASDVQELSGKSTALVYRLLKGMRAPDVTVPTEDIAVQRGRIVGANVGDSCALLIRPDKGVIAEAPRQRQGRAPHQLPDYPQGLYARDKYDFEWAVQEGDVVVAGSDGLFDNLFPEEIAETVQQLVWEGNPAPQDISKRVAERLVALAREKAFNEEPPPEDEARKMLNLEKPFSTPHITMAFKDLVQRGKQRKGISMKEAHDLGCWGGKADDTTIVVSTLTCQPRPPGSLSGVTMFERGKILQ